MKMNKVALSLLAVCIGFSGASLASGIDYTSYEKSDESAEEEKKKHKRYKDHYKKYHPEIEDAGRLALNLVGKGNMYEKEVPDIDGDKQPDIASCFDVDLKDIEDGEIIGTATDCLSEITDEGEGKKLIGTTFFNLPGGKIITRGLTTVQPVLQDTVTPDGEEITHITGAASDKNGIIKATGKYRGHIGHVRLSGMVNLDEFDGVDTPIYFDCLFIIDLKEVKGKGTHWYKWYKDQHSQNFYNAHYDIEDDESENPYEDTGDSGDPYDDVEVTDPDEEEKDDYEVTDPDEDEKDDYEVTDPDEEEKYDYEVTDPDEEEKDDYEATDPDEEEKDDYEATDPDEEEKDDYEVTDPEEEEKDDYEVTDPDEEEKDDYEATDPDEEEKDDYEVTDPEEEEKDEYEATESEEESDDKDDSEYVSYRY